MSITNPFKFNEKVEYRVGCQYTPSHQFSLVHQIIKQSKKIYKSFD